MAGLVPAIHVFAALGQKDVDARDERGHDESERRRKQQQKSPAENRGAFDLDIVKEDIPSLADLAATYSSKP